VGGGWEGPECSRRRGVGSFNHGKPEKEQQVEHTFPSSRLQRNKTGAKSKVLATEKGRKRLKFPMLGPGQGQKSKMGIRSNQSEEIN